MVVKQILFFFCCVMLFMRCDSNQTPTIRAICVRDNIGNYIIKWETDPQMEGKMKLYVSDTPDAFNLSAPCAYADIQEGIVTYITDDNISRKYFLLSFNDNYFRTIGARFVQMDGIQNLRDIGGYFDRKRQHMTQWGKVYRSGVIRALSSNDKIRMKNLNIKTIIDLRGDDERKRMPEQPTDANVISIPIPIKEKDLISRNNNDFDLWDPLGDLLDLPPHMRHNRELNNLMRTDIKEKDDAYELEVDLPGFKKEDISLDIDNGYLTISAQKHDEHEEHEKHHYIRKERYFGSAQRSFYVGDVKEENINAKLENGTLSITIPKEKPVETKKRIEIK